MMMIGVTLGTLLLLVSILFGLLKMFILLLIIISVVMVRLVLFFSFIAFLGSCTTLHGTADGKSIIVRNDTITVNYGGTVSKSY